MSDNLKKTECERALTDENDHNLHGRRIIILYNLS